MAIQHRRGNERDFDPNKLLPGEWAVFLDTQKVWMCFAPGIVKRLGTYEDFYAQITEATKDIRDSYVDDFNEIKADIELIADVVSSGKEEVLIIKSDIVNTYLPQIQALTERAETATSKAETSANNSSTSATLSQSYAVGGTGTREGENADNAKYYYEQAKHISQGGNGLVPMGTIAFEDIPTTDIVTNAMYNISNDFTSDERFVDGGGVLYGKGSNIFYTVDGLWDVLAASDVKGVKGAAEDTYRQGNVNITSENVGAVAVGGDTADNIVEFTSSDLSEPTEWTDVAVLASGEKHSSIFNKISTIFKNVRYLYKMLGTTDISSISDGTISGVLAFLKSELDDVNSNLNTKQDKIMSKTVTRTTDGSGSTYLGVLSSNAKVLCISPCNGAIAIPYIYSDGSWYVKILNANDMTPVVNASMDIKYWYI